MLWRLEGWGESVKKSKSLWRKSFSDNVEWSEEKYKKMVCVDVKTDRNKKLVAISFYKKYLWNLKQNGTTKGVLFI